ncbi:MAG TPA: ATPase, partial [Cupriavidus sp.]|nr:ATPase [Cupriavidus sp.]
TPLLACIPRDLLRLVASHVRYHGHAPQVTEESLCRAWQGYYGLQGKPEAPPPDNEHRWPAGHRAAG